MIGAMNARTERPRLFSHLTRTRFLHIEDALERGKLRFFIGTFERGQGASQTAYGFMDVEDARVIFNDLAWGKPVEFMDYKGGKNGDGMIVSRIIKIKCTEENKIWVNIQNGLGTYEDGIIKPKGKATAEISIPLTTYEGRKMGFAVLAYLQAWEVVRVSGSRFQVPSL